jgi:hypothetical protein
MSQQQQPTLERVIVRSQVEELRKTVEDVRKALAELKERILKIEVDFNVIESGYHVICNALEINGLMSAGEPVQRPENTAPKKEPVAAVSETTFTILKWDPQQGAKIGSYEVAYKASNVEDKWISAFNILRQSDSTIKERYHGQGYEFSYWLYGQDKIYRQKLKAKT